MNSIAEPYNANNVLIYLRTDRSSNDDTQTSLEKIENAKFANTGAGEEFSVSLNVDLVCVK